MRPLSALLTFMALCSLACAKGDEATSTSWDAGGYADCLDGALTDLDDCGDDCIADQEACNSRCGDSDCISQCYDAANRCLDDCDADYTSASETCEALYGY